jgi:hypothetical protein
MSGIVNSAETLAGGGFLPSTKKYKVLLWLSAVFVLGENAALYGRWNLPLYSIAVALGIVAIGFIVVKVVAPASLGKVAYLLVTTIVFLLSVGLALYQGGPR